VTSFYRRLLQQLAFSKLGHFSWDKDLANTMVRRLMTETSTKASKSARLNHEVPQKHKKGNNQTEKIIPIKTHKPP
jgi:hypothetical protein